MKIDFKTGAILFGIIVVGVGLAIMGAMKLTPSEEE